MRAVTGGARSIAFVALGCIFMSAKSFVIFSPATTTTTGGAVRAHLEREYWDSLSTEETKLARSMAAGMQFFISKDLDSALREWDNVLQMDPDHYIFQRGLALFCSQRYEDAFLQFQKDAELFETKYADSATEERIWAAASRLMTSDDLPPLPPLQLKESDPFKRHAYEMLAGISSHGMLELESKGKLPTEGEKDSFGRGFFWDVYVAIFYHSQGKQEEANKLMRRATLRTLGNSDNWSIVPHTWLQNYT
jgi:tetratricopeptide (TPR) repeat protein